MVTRFRIGLHDSAIVSLELKLTAMSASSKIAFFEGLRGWCALAVAVGHFTNCYFPPPGKPWPQAFLGSTGVRIFFALSGFVLSLGQLKSPRPEALVSACCRRFMRLWWPAFAAHVLAWLCTKYGGFRPGVEMAAAFNTEWPIVVFQEPALVPHSVQTLLVSGLYDIWFLDPARLPLQYNRAVIWTMHYEIVGSFLVFLTTCVARSVRNRWLVYGFVGAAVWGASPMGWNWLWCDFIVGIALADAYCCGWFGSAPLGVAVARVADKAQLDSVPDAAPARASSVYCTIAGRRVVVDAWDLLREAIGLGLVACGLVLAYYQIGGQQYYLARTGLVGEATAIVVGVLLSGTMRWWFSTAFSVWLGKVSFALYLLHGTLIGLISSRIALQLQAAGVSQMANYWIVLAITLVLLVPVVAAFQWAVDDKGIKLAAFLSQRYFMPVAKPIVHAAAPTAPHAAAAAPPVASTDVSVAVSAVPSSATTSGPDGRAAVGLPQGDAPRSRASSSAAAGPGAHAHAVAASPPASAPSASIHDAVVARTGLTDRQPAPFLPSDRDILGLPAAAQTHLYALFRGDPSRALPHWLQPPTGRGVWLVRLLAPLYLLAALVFTAIRLPLIMVAHAFDLVAALWRFDAVIAVHAVGCCALLAAVAIADRAQGVK